LKSSLAMMTGIIMDRVLMLGNSLTMTIRFRADCGEVEGVEENVWNGQGVLGGGSM